MTLLTIVIIDPYLYVAFFAILWSLVAAQTYMSLYWFFSGAWIREGKEIWNLIFKKEKKESNPFIDWMG